MRVRDRDEGVFPLWAILYAVTHRALNVPLKLVRFMVFLMARLWGFDHAATTPNRTNPVGFGFMEYSFTTCNDDDTDLLDINPTRSRP